MNTFSQLAAKSLSALTLSALVMSAFGVALVQAPVAFASGTAVTTVPATNITASDATLNGINQSTAAADSSFWVSTSTFSVASSAVPAGVYSTPLLGPVAADAAFSSPLTAVSGILPVTASTTYYFAAWTDVGGTWSPGAVLQFTTAGTAATSSLQAQDFGVMDASGVKGYTAGFGLTNADLTGAQSIVTQLYSGATLLQTDTASNLGAFAGFTQFSSPFDVFGTFNYVADGYWTNVRGAEYGQTLTPTKVIATIKLASGQIVTAENSNLTGDPSTIRPAAALAAPTLLSPANGSSTTTAGQMFASWSSVNDAAGGITYVYQSANSSAVNPDGTFVTPVYTSGPLATTTIPTPGTPEGTYYWHVQATDASSTQSAWSRTWMFVVDNSGTGGTITGTTTGGGSAGGTLAVTSITPVDTTATADGTFANGWKYIFHITMPTSETNLAMRFADWINAAASSTIAVANNMRISSPQADNSGATVLLTAANTYSTPALHMTSDTDPATRGLQVDVTVEVAVPTGTVDGTYSTSYGVRSQP